MPVGNKVTRPVPNGRCVDTLPEQGDGGCAPIQLIEAEQDVVGDVFGLYGLLHGVELDFGSVQCGNFEALQRLYRFGVGINNVVLASDTDEDLAIEEAPKVRVVRNKIKGI